MIQIWLPVLVVLVILAGWAVVASALFLISKKRIQQTERRYETLCQLSQTDPLTGLPNRTALLARSADRPPQTQPGQAESAIFIDFDNFRVVNEALGHVAGDRILKELALALVQSLHGKGEVFRIGGDEFLIVLKAERLEELEAIARSAQRILARQVTINQRSFYLTTSIGIHEALPGDTLEDSLRKADIALFFAKKLRNNILVYSPRMESSRTRDSILSQDLPAALDHHQFELTYQPIVSATQGQLLAVEAKAVWLHPEFGTILVDEWTPVAETSRLVIPLQDWMIQQACRQLVKWQQQGLAAVPICCAVSPVWFESHLGDLAETASQAIARSGVDPKHMILMIPESALADKPEDVVRTLLQLHAAGIQLILDKFGIGYVALRWLDQLPLMGIRLDPALVISVDDPEASTSLLKSLLAFTHSLDLLLMATGIESKLQADALKSMGCDAFQGSLVGSSLHEDDLLAWIREGRHELR